MNLLKNAKVKNKLLFMTAIAVIFLIVLGLTGVYYESVSNKSIDAMYQNSLLCNEYLEEAKNAYNSENTDIFELMLTTDPARNKELQQSIATKKSNLNKYMDKLSSSVIDSYENSQLAEYKTYSSNASNIKTNVINLALQNNNAAAYDLYNKRLSSVNKKIETILSNMTQHNISAASSLNADNQKNYKKTLIIISTLILIALIAVLFISMFITNLIVKPIQSFESYIEKLTYGDLSKETLEKFQASKIYNDEIGNLGNSISIMREKLWELLIKVSDSAEQIAASSEELSANSEETSKTIQETAISVSDISSGSEAQLSMVNDTSEVISKISDSIYKSSESNMSTAKTAEKALIATTDGRNAISTTKKQMDHIEKTVFDINVIIETLGNKSNEIGSIVEAISDIAEQTNLLALNAAIEAARAGEHGKGFAVVAEEVRQLAEGSKESTEKISALIHDIQSMTSNAVASMSEGTKQVQIGMSVVENAGEAFEYISNLVENITSQVKEAAVTSKNIATGNNQVVSSINKVDAVSKNMSEQTTTIAASIEEQTAAMHEIAQASESLANIGETLMTELSNFKL